ncbi:hypothetical protein D3C84_903670 [compost metagenome]
MLNIRKRILVQPEVRFLLLCLSVILDNEVLAELRPAVPAVKRFKIGSVMIKQLLRRAFHKLRIWRDAEPIGIVIP